MTDLNNFVTNYASNCNSAAANLNLALEYSRIGQIASASMYFLRAAELYQDKQSAYECLLKCAECYSLNRGSDFTCFTLLSHAIAIMPLRPEAYYYYSKFSRENGFYVNSYLYSRIALQICSFGEIPLKWVSYPGKDGIIDEFNIASMARENNYIKRFELT